MRSVGSLRVLSPEKELSVANFLRGKKNGKSLKLSKYPIWIIYKGFVVVKKQALIYILDNSKEKENNFKKGFFFN